MSPWAVLLSLFDWREHDTSVPKKAITITAGNLAMICYLGASACFSCLCARGSYHALSCHCPTEFTQVCAASLYFASLRERESKMGALALPPKNRNDYRGRWSVHSTLSEPDIQLCVCRHQRDLLCHLPYPFLNPPWISMSNFRPKQMVVKGNRSLDYIIIRLECCRSDVTPLCWFIPG